jgi:hypothetical protein
MDALAAAPGCRARSVIHRAKTTRRGCPKALNPMARDGWSKRFDDPIVLDDGTTLRTLRDAIQYLADTVPKAEQKHEKVAIAADHLIRSAEQNYPMYFEGAATLQAIYRNKERVFNPDRKDHHWAPRTAACVGRSRAPEARRRAGGRVSPSYSFAGLGSHGRPAVRLRRPEGPSQKHPAYPWSARHPGTGSWS